MFRAHPAAPHAGGLGGGQLHHPAAAGSQPLGRHGRRRAGADQANDGFPRSAYVQAGVPEHAAGHALSLQQHAQQKVFRAHIAVPKLSRGLVGQSQGRLGALGKLVFADGESPPSLVVCCGGGIRRVWARLWAAPSSSGARAPAISASKRRLSSRMNAHLAFHVMLFYPLRGNIPTSKKK